MKNTFGNNISVTLFGESHGQAIGAVVDGLPSGISVDRNYIAKKLEQRRPFGDISTKRKETDNFEILSGVFEGKTCGTPICTVIPNEDTRSKDYSKTFGIARPSHADFAAHIKYKGFEDYRGGGHFSGRITAALVAVGAILQYALEQKGIMLGTHIKRCASIDDRGFENLSDDIKTVNGMQFACLDSVAANKMQEQIKMAAANNDSVGGILETAVTGMPAGIGEPFFDGMESILSHALFSVPAVKGVEFGDGFKLCDMQGSAANDPFVIRNGKIETQKNSSGGINGGITNGMPILFRTAIKPTPTISKPQKTVDFVNMKECETVFVGRHDPCIVHRARAVVDAVTAITLCDMLATAFGTEGLR